MPDFVLPQPIPYVAAPSATFEARASGLGPFGGFSTLAWASDASVLASEASAVVTRSFQNNPNDPYIFDQFIREELAFTPEAYADLVGQPVAIDFDGPAQDSDSHHVFPYTFATLVNDQPKYAQLLFWYFAGKPYRVTKAVRIPLDGGAGAQTSRVLAAAAEDLDTRRSQLVNSATATDRLAQGHALFVGFAGSSDPGG